jgi:sporulation protein YlmC with PRC-barrel domain
MVMLGKIKDLEIDTTEVKLTNLVVEVEKQVAKEALGKIIVMRHAKARIQLHWLKALKMRLFSNNRSMN